MAEEDHHLGMVSAKYLGHRRDVELNIRESRCVFLLIISMYA
jgi:sporulation protein YlmC with PRC-barrel domain